METDAYISAAPRNASLLTQFGLENQRFARNGRSMIISASYKTDIPAFYGSWFERRLIEGYADVRNVWNGKQFSVDLRPEAVSGFVFWTRNSAPFLNTLQRLNEEDVAFVVQFTSIGYPRQIERSVIGSEVSVEQIRALSRRFGTRSVVWRYDPVLLTDDVDTAWHERNFATLAMALKGHVDEVVLSFAQIYRKSARNLRFAGVNWRDPEVKEKRALLSKLAGIASEANIRPTLCAQPDLLSPGLELAACIDAKRLSDIAGDQIKARKKGNREGCLCAESRDIGAYDTCPHGCTYCYAVSNMEKTKHFVKNFSPAQVGLLGS